MKRLPRVIFNALTVLSLLLCVATVGLWVRSFSAEPGIEFSRKGERCRICVIRGRLIEDNEPERRYRDDIGRQLVGKLRAMLALRHNDQGVLSQADVAEQRRLVQELEDRYSRSWARSTPWALPLTILVTGAFSAITLQRRLVVRRRKRLGHCPKCGYDLRATPDRCPECGTIPAKS